MTTQADFAAIAALDFDRIKTKLCHMESGEGWSRARADAVEVEYRRFLFLMKAYPTEQTVPSVEVDIFWHYHILDTVKYAADCKAAFGYFLHHDPSVGLAGADEAADRLQRAARMDELYAATFGPALATEAAGDYSRRSPVKYTGAALAAAAWCGMATSEKVAEKAAAWCGMATSEKAAAWCGMATSEKAAAWCGMATSEKAAEKSAAWCGMATSEKAAAWCGMATSETAAAWCGMATSEQLAAPADDTVAA
jgi:hypothetical protein